MRDKRVMTILAAIGAATCFGVLIAGMVASGGVLLLAWAVLAPVCVAVLFVPLALSYTYSRPSTAFALLLGSAALAFGPLLLLGGVLTNSPIALLFLLPVLPLLLAAFIQYSTRNETPPLDSLDSLLANNSQLPTLGLRLLLLTTERSHSGGVATPRLPSSRFRRHSLHQWCSRLAPAVCMDEQTARGVSRDQARARRFEDGMRGPASTEYR